ncbi:MAG: hypothetical protein JW942_03275 [Opitutales bacterium]|nr:hypothetical protein [Opitutales bacterium]
MQLAKRMHRLIHAIMVRMRNAEPSRLLVFGYFYYVLFGTALLALPFCRVDGAGSPLDWLFTATSAVSTTGLATMSVGHDYTLAGQIVILLLIQLGGLGYMTMGSFVLLSVSGRMAPWRETAQRMVLNLPDNVDMRQTVRLIIIYTLTVEASGAVALYWLFHRAGVDESAWSAIFHSVSAFCTAGFGLHDDSMIAFRDNAAVNIVICSLSILGAMGFLIVSDLWKSIVGRAVKITLTTRIIVVSTIVILASGCLLMRIEEPLLRGDGLTGGWLGAFFQVVSASTTVGFNSLPIEQLSNASTLLLMVLMLVGGSPAGTGGGIKTTTVTALWAMTVSVIRHSPEPCFAGKAIPEARRRIAVATTLFYMLMLCGGVYLMSIFQKASLLDISFECASALGTVGLSRGLTGSLNEVGKIIIIALMFVGRIGPLALAGTLFVSRTPHPEAPKTEDVVI